MRSWTTGLDYRHSRGITFPLTMQVEWASALRCRGLLLWWFEKKNGGRLGTHLKRRIQFLSSFEIAHRKTPSSCPNLWAMLEGVLSVLMGMYLYELQ